MLHPTLEIPLAELSLAHDVPNFKADADASTGVVTGQRLEGQYERLGTGAIAVWQRLGGARKVISGRHRFDLARRCHETTIPAQILREADGFTREMAMALDAEMNIRDGQGSTADYAAYFKRAQLTEAEARRRGLLSRPKGQAGWTLAQWAGPDLYALYRAGQVTEEQAVAIARAAPSDSALQRVALKPARRGASPDHLAHFVQAVRYRMHDQPPGQLDLFGADDAAMKTALRLAGCALQLQRAIDLAIKATDNAARHAEIAQSKGLAFHRPPAHILAENAALRFQREQWSNWSLHPALVQQVLRAAA